MSKVRGVFPLFLATALGIGNALWIFDPEFKAQREMKDKIAREAEEVNPPSTEQQAQTETTRVAEASASRSSATQTALKPNEASNSWWSKLGFGSAPTAKDGELLTKENVNTNGDRPADK